MIEESLISIIVPIYNVEEYIDKCIHSLVNQTYKNVEVILVNDGSTDNSLQKCEKWEKMYTNVFLYSKENGGLSDARNYGLKHAKGDYVVFIDSDDWVDEKLCEILYKNLIDQKTDISTCDVVEVLDKNLEYSADYSNEICTPKSKEELLRYYLNNEKGFFEGCTHRLYKKSLFNDLEFPVNKIHEDSFMTFALFDKCSSACSTSAKLYFFNKTNVSITRSKFSERKLYKLQAYQSILDTCKLKYPGLVKYARSNMLGVMLYFYILTYSSENHKDVNASLYNQIISEKANIFNCRLKILILKIIVELPDFFSHYFIMRLSKSLNKY